MLVASYAAVFSVAPTLSPHERLLKRALHSIPLIWPIRANLLKTGRLTLTLAEACESIDFTLHRNQTLSEQVCRPCGLKIRNAAELYNFIKRSASSDGPEGETYRTTLEKMAHGEPGRLKMNFEETKTVKPYFSSSLSSLLGFWVVLEPFRVFFFFSFRFFFSIFLFAKCHFANQNQFVGN